ncbi:MAG: hypothetical protein IKE17_03740 [Clostridia bacterium]|nr:hypothetical protein [Clostridia bacterium]
MKRWKDPFPQTPKGFHDRVEQTLGGLENKNMRNHHNNRKLRIAMIAALIAILATTAVAVAVVLGNARFKQALTDSGADEVAELVQEVHVPAAESEDGGFALSIDEIIWEDDQLYFSYTASVPEDGNRYLLALYTPLLNGEPMVFYATGWEASAFFDDRFQTVIPLGGVQPATCGQLLTFKVNPTLRQRASNALFLRADFFKTDIDFTNNQSGFESQFKGVVPTVVLTFDESDGFGESFDSYAQRLELSAREREALRSIVDAADGDGILTPEELSGVEGIEYATRRETRMAVDASKLAQTVYDGVAEREFEVNGCKLTVEDFHITHLGASFRLRVTAPAGMNEEEGMRLASSVAFPGQVNEHGYTWSLLRPDGSELALDQGWEGGAGYQPLPDGTASYGINYDINGIIPLDGLEKVILMPYRLAYDENDNKTFDYRKDWAVELTPILRPAQTIAEPIQTLSPEEQAAFDGFMNGEVVTRLERQVAAANWKAGDPTVTVYATERGKYYHVDIDCSDMQNAFPWAIEDAVKGGKLPCPDCVGGPNAPDKVDIMNNELSFPDND